MKRTAPDPAATELPKESLKAHTNSGLSKTVDDLSTAVNHTETLLLQVQNAYPQSSTPPAGATPVTPPASSPNEEWIDDDVITTTTNSLFTSAGDSESNAPPGSPLYYTSLEDTHFNAFSDEGGESISSGVSFLNGCYLISSSTP